MKYLFLIFIILNNVQALDKTVSVEGECEKSVTPDRASLVLTIENIDKSVKVANQKTSDTYAHVKKDVESMNLKSVELRTTEFNVNEHKEWENQKMISKGFKSRMGLFIATDDLNKIGDVMVVANKHGVQEVGSLNMFISDSKLKNLKDDCLKEASYDAKRKADVLAKALGTKVLEVLTISETATSAPLPRPMPMMRGAMKMMSADAEMASPTVEAGKEKFNLKIYTTFKID